MLLNRETVKKRLIIYLLSVVALVVVIVNFTSSRLMPLIIKYGEYQCYNISTRMVNYIISNQVSKELEEKMIVSSKDDESFVEYNTAMINSIASNTIMNLQKNFYLLENGTVGDGLIDVLGLDIEANKLKKGIMYEVPISYALNSPLISNLGVTIPVRYKLIGDLNGKIVSCVREYGINNFLFEILLEITCKMSISVPMLMEEKSNVITVPLVIRSIQGEIPDFYLGRNVIGEVK